ncbi:enhanced serine sensitivity protein SseB [Shimwellia pseudoproteus]|uniref:enhanced serine sensitivity protein SseB n=1 Tax=Shimwellia pseudoproteus TaxID=570012 RepID=UPI0018EB47CC|nr:enhanced serine sensitivity protein SseB [Shimwellia pseudoproteus]MBJ3815674.1 enhanced serine sensitivity protein SseB [Shimwellia pseudoproteus]
MSDKQLTLDDLLAQAATEPAHRPAFFRALLGATVWVPGRQDGDDPHSLELEHWERDNGSDVIPFFSSQQALAQAASGEQSWVMMPATTLFDITAGETLFLNARLPVGKEFTPSEIRHLLGNTGDPLSQQSVMEGQSELLLSEVTEPPAALVDSLTVLFTSLKTVKRAWLSRVKAPQDSEANLLIGLEIAGDAEAVIQATGSVATDVLPGDAPVDICEIVEGEPGISHFMQAHLTPFYERRWGSFLRDYKTGRIL